MGFGIGTSEIEHLLATQTLVYRMAGTMRISIAGQLPAGTEPKDLALAVLRRISARGALGKVVEYCGLAVDALTIEGRMTLCNLTVEAGARGALIAPDDKALEWVKKHAAGLSDEDFSAMAAYAKELRSDPGASFDTEIELNADDTAPMVTWGTSPEQSVAIDEVIPDPNAFTDEIERSAALRGLAYQGLSAGRRMAGVPIQHVFIGSCTNGRISDLRAAAAILKGRKVHPSVCAQVMPGSMAVRRQAEMEGLDKIFKEAGFQWRKSGCSLCLAMNGDMLADGVRCASTTNRNFEGRQGRGARTHLVSPTTAAASAVAGVITDPRTMTRL